MASGSNGEEQSQDLLELAVAEEVGDSGFDRTGSCVTGSTRFDFAFELCVSSSKGLSLRE